MRIRLLVATVSLSLVALHASVLSQTADPAAALSGGWRLNMDASTNPNGPAGAGARGSRGGGRGSSDRVGVGPPPGGDLGREEMQRFNAHLKMFHTAPPLLGIQATANDVMIAYDPDPARGLIYKYTTDNKKSVMTTPAGPVDIKVKWNNKVLRREMETKESLKVVESYTVSADGKQLVVTVETSNIMVRMPKVDITRVYDRVQ